MILVIVLVSDLSKKNKQHHSFLHHRYNILKSFCSNWGNSVIFLDNVVRTGSYWLRLLIGKSKFYSWANKSRKFMLLFSSNTFVYSSSLWIKGKESENFYQELKISLKNRHTQTQKLYRDISTGTAVFFNRKRVNVSEYTTEMAPSLSCVH